MAGAPPLGFCLEGDPGEAFLPPPRPMPRPRSRHVTTPRLAGDLPSASSSEGLLPPDAVLAVLVVEALFLPWRRLLRVRRLRADVGDRGVSRSSSSNSESPSTSELAGGVSMMRMS